MDDEHLKSIEKAAIEIFDKAERREKAGRGHFEAGWQATLETMLLVVEKNIVKQPGQLLAMQIENQEEWEFYLNIKGKLDLPPETSALVVTPSAFKSIPSIENVEMGHFWPKAWERNAYSLIVSGLEDHEKIGILQMSRKVVYTFCRMFFKQTHRVSSLLSAISLCRCFRQKIIR